MSEVKHQRIKTNGIWMHVAEKGTGPLVLLLHGFPEIWYAWRHQLNFLAQHGYHAVAPDLRGYGDSDSPIDPNSYTFHHLVGDLIGLLDHFGQQQVSYLTVLLFCLHLNFKFILCVPMSRNFI
uniref:AB hydrolase superfamily protein yfhM n=1 Tax=Cajanus cajan TaxID=3821 RepID=A0A151RAN9_CAJCA|nr:AB hydrolase superfamily protein yfhM [Cajanus cajan]